MANKRTPNVFALIACLTLSADTLGDEFQHEAMVMAKLGNHPNVIQFVGTTIIDTQLTTDARGYNNPIYQENSMQGENPLFEGAADPGTPNAIQSITFEIDNTALSAQDHGGGVVHRDIAARNFLIQANGGTYSSASGESLLFGHDGPSDLRTNVGPVRWMAPESLRLHRNGSSGPDDYIEIQAFSYFDASYVPEPATLTLLGLGTLLCTRRRR